MTHGNPIVSGKKLDLHTSVDEVSELVCVPVGQADAPVRLRLVDLGRLRRSMDSIGWLGQINPDGTNRPVWPRRNRQRFGIVALLKILVGVVCVGRVDRDGLYLMGTRR